MATADDRKSPSVTVTWSRANPPTLCTLCCSSAKRSASISNASTWSKYLNPRQSWRYSVAHEACISRRAGNVTAAAAAAPCVRAYRANDSVLPPTQAVASVTERRLVQGRFTLSCRCAPTSMMARRNSEIRSAVYLAAKRQPQSAVGWCKRGATGGNNPCYASRAAAPK